MTLIDPRFAQCNFAVEADAFAQSRLWQQHNSTHTWVDDSSGRIVNVGQFGGEVITLTAAWSTIDGQRVLFYCCDSQVVHWGVVNEWLKQNVPAFGEIGIGRRSFSDASNFGNIIFGIEQTKRESR